VFLRSGEGEEQRTSLVQQITPESPLTERQITNKLVQIGQENVATAYFLQGHGEYAIDGSQAGYFEARSELQAQNYTVAPVDLANTGTIPPDADVVIIAGPKTKLFDNEVIAIQEYLEGGGSLMVLVDPQIETGLEVLMSQWGVVPEDKLVIDTSGGGQIVGLGPATALVQDYGDHPITAAFGNDRSFFPAARPLQIREVPDVEATTLLFTNQNSHAQALADGEQEIDPNRPPEGPLAIGVALSQSVEAIEEKQANTQADAAESADQAAAEEEATAELPSVEEAIEDSLTEEELLGDAVGNTDESADESGEIEGRMVIIGNSRFATDGLFNQQLNGDLFLNSVSWLSKLDDPVLSIRPKEVTNRRFEMTVGQQIFLTLLALVIFPLGGLIGAGTLWLVRR